MAGEPCRAGKRGERPRVHVARGRNTARRRGARVRRARGARGAAGGSLRSSVSRGARSVRASVLRASPRARARQHVARRRALGARAYAPLSQAESTRPACRAARGELTTASGGFLCLLLRAMRPLLAVAAAIDFAAPCTFVAFTHVRIIAAPGSLQARTRDRVQAISPPRRHSALRDVRSPRAGRGRPCPRRSSPTADATDRTRIPTRPAAWQTTR